MSVFPHDFDNWRNDTYVFLYLNKNIKKSPCRVITHLSKTPYTVNLLTTSRRTETFNFELIWSGQKKDIKEIYERDKAPYSHTDDTPPDTRARSSIDLENPSPQ